MSQGKINFSHKKLIILDRDGVINHDSANYIKSVAEFHPLEGSLTAIKKLNDAGKLVTIATNQSGIARGFFSEKTLHDMHQHLEILLAQQHGAIDAIVYCPHGPDDHCECRKPKAGMLKVLLQQFNVKVEQALLIGDAYRDLQAAHSIGMDAILLKTGKGEKTLVEHMITVPVYNDLLSATQAILNG